MLVCFTRRRLQPMRRRTRLKPAARPCFVVCLSFYTKHPQASAQLHHQDFASGCVFPPRNVMPAPLSLSIPLGAASIAALALLLPHAALDSCRSFPSHHFKSFNIATEVLLNAIIAAIFLTITLFDRSSRSIQALGCSMTASLTLLVAVTALKEILRDTTCSHHANSVSGHVAFHVFAVLALRDCVVVGRRGALITTLQRLHPLAALAVLCNTYIGGCEAAFHLHSLHSDTVCNTSTRYHSLRQMLLGLLLSSLFFALYALSSIWMRAEPLRCALASASAFVIVIGIAVSLPNDHIPVRLGQLLMYANTIHLLPRSKSQTTAHAPEQTPTHIVPYLPGNGASSFSFSAFGSSTRPSSLRATQIARASRQRLWNHFPVRSMRAPKSKGSPQTQRSMLLRVKKLWPCRS